MEGFWNALQSMCCKLKKRSFLLQGELREAMCEQYWGIRQSTHEDILSARRSIPSAGAEHGLFSTSRTSKVSNRHVTSLDPSGFPSPLSVSEQDIKWTYIIREHDFLSHLSVSEEGHFWDLIGDKSLIATSSWLFLYFAVCILYCPVRGLYCFIVFSASLPGREVIPCLVPVLAGKRQRGVSSDFLQSSPRA